MVEDLDKDIFEKLWRRNKFGDDYIPKEQSFSGISVEDHGDAKDVVHEYVKKGWLLAHKNGECISINREFKQQVRELLEGYVADFVLDHR